MNRRIAFVLVLLLLFSAIGVGAASAGVDPNEASAKCTYVAEMYPGYFDYKYDSHGDCVSHYNANNGPVEFCKLWRDELPYFPWFPPAGFYFWFDNLGGCVSSLR